MMDNMNGQGQPPGQNRRTTLSEKRIHFIFHKYDPDKTSLSGSSSETYLDEDGPKVDETFTVYEGACGHFIILGDQSMPSSRCSLCSHLICSQCSSTRCAKCGLIVCPRCSVTIDDEIFCVTCKRSFRWKKVIAFLMHAIHKIHELFSREF